MSLVGVILGLGLEKFRFLGLEKLRGAGRRASFSLSFNEIIDGAGCGDGKSPSSSKTLSLCDMIAARWS